MLIRSNRPFQDGGNRETIVPEECGPLKVSGKRNGGCGNRWWAAKSLPLTPSPLFLSVRLYFLVRVALTGV